MYFTAIFATALNLVLLRFGPRVDHGASELDDHGGEDMGEALNELAGLMDPARDAETGAVGAKSGGDVPSYQSTAQDISTIQHMNSTHSTRSRRSGRARPSLAV